MKPTNRILIILATLTAAAPLSAVEPWEGTDDFSSGANSLSRWTKIVDHPTQGRAIFEDGEVRYSAAGNASDAAWTWGKKAHLIPSSASWQMECTLRLPTNPPLGVNFTKAGMFVGSKNVGKGSYRALTFKVYQRYDSNSGTTSGFPQPIPETDYSRDGELERSNDLPLTNFYSTLALVYRHDALNQSDDYEIYEVTGGTNRSLLASETYQSGLAAEQSVIVGFVLAGKPNWSGTGLALDNWAVTAFAPGTLNLPAITKPGSTIEGSAWTLTITGLEVVKSGKGKWVPQGTANLEFGVNNLSIPVTGAIQKDGTFLLLGKGTGAANGYGFRVVYDTYNSVRINNGTAITAPNQKPIKF